MATHVRVISGTFGKTEYHVTENRHARPLYALADIPRNDRERFDYIDAEDYSARLFSYRGAWYDAHGFERAGDDVRALGYDGVQAQSAWDAVVITYFDRNGYELDDAVIVGRISW